MEACNSPCSREIFMLKRGRERRVPMSTLYHNSDYTHNNNIILLFGTAAVAAGQRSGRVIAVGRKGVNTKQRVPLLIMHGQCVRRDFMRMWRTGNSGSTMDDLCGHCATRVPKRNGTHNAISRRLWPAGATQNA